MTTPTTHTTRLDKCPPGLVHVAAHDWCEAVERLDTAEDMQTEPSARDADGTDGFFPQWPRDAQNLA